MLRRVMRVATLSACALTLAPLARAQDDKAETTVADARTALEDKRYADAIRLVEPLRKSGPPSIRADALEIIGVAALMLGKADQGKQAVHELYELEPGFELRDTSLPEAVTTAFQNAEAEPHARKVTLRLEPAIQGPTAFDLTSSGEVAEVRIACRVSGGKAFVPLGTSRTGAAYRFQLPAARPHICFALALDADGLLVGRLGSRLQPVDVVPRAPTSAAGTTPAKPTEKPSPPVTSRWWFWTALGTVAAAGAVTIVVIAVSGKSDGSSGETVGHTKPTLISW